MSSSHPAGSHPLRSALKNDDDADRTPPTSCTLKAVQIAEPVPEDFIEDDSQVPVRQFKAGHTRRLSGRAPSVSLSSFPSRSSLTESPLLRPADAPISPLTTISQGQPSAAGSSSSGTRQQYYSEKLLAQVADWLDHQKRKAQAKKTRKTSRRRKSKSPPQDPNDATPPARPRSDSIDSESSDVSLESLQRILEESMASFGLSAIPKHPPKVSRTRHGSLGSLRRSSRSSLYKNAASSDTDYVDGDAIVPSCDAWLDNSKTLSYSGGGGASTDDLSMSPSAAVDKERDAWLTFKNEIIRIAHTLRLKGWRRVPLGSGDSIDVQRLSGALTNAVYVVTPPFGIPRIEGKKMPPKLLLRVYGPQVEHLIDRENELQVLKRLARKKIGPRLLGCFKNGRFEQFFNAITLSPMDLREPSTSKQIAKRMRELHEGIEVLPTERAAGPNVWRNWDQWLEKVEIIIQFLDKELEAREGVKPPSNSIHAWMANGYVCGTPWAQYKAVLLKYRAHLEAVYKTQDAINEQLIFAHNDTQYGNILRIRPDDEKSPLLQAANVHKQLIVIDFEYAAANIPGLEFANHFTEWTYNYHDPVYSWACDTRRYPTVEEQRRFVKAYVEHRPQFPSHAAATPRLSALDSAASTPSLGPRTPSFGPSTPSMGPTTPSLGPTTSTSSIVDFMLDARVPAGGTNAAEERAKEEQSDLQVRELLEETRLWRPANHAQWISWGIVQAKVPGLQDGEGMDKAVEDIDLGEAAMETNVDDEMGEDEFDYLSYSQDRACFFWGDMVQMGLAKMEELPESLRVRIKCIET